MQIDKHAFLVLYDVDSIFDWGDLVELAEEPYRLITVECEDYDTALSIAINEATEHGSVRAIRHWHGPSNLRQFNPQPEIDAGYYYLTFSGDDSTPELCLIVKEDGMVFYQSPNIERSSDWTVVDHYERFEK